MKFNERMLESAARNRSRVVLALDFSGPYDKRLARASKVLEATKKSVAAVKVNHHLLLPFGLKGIEGIVQTCRSERLPLIADLKVNDIESTNMNIVDSLLDFGFDAVIANPFVGKEEGLGKVIQKLHSKDAGILLLVYMSHEGAREGYSLLMRDDKPLYRLFAERARDWGADGVVVSAKSSEMIAETRGVIGKDCLIFSPGIGPQGGVAATASGADFVIVGRSITESEDPSRAARAATG